jgi:hypothetical protein
MSSILTGKSNKKEGRKGKGKKEQGHFYLLPFTFYLKGGSVFIKRGKNFEVYGKSFVTAPPAQKRHAN